MYSFTGAAGYFMDHSGGISPAFGVPAGLSGGFGHIPPLQQLQAHLMRNNPLSGSLPNSPFLAPSFLHNSPFAGHHGIYMTPHHLHSLNIKQEVKHQSTNTGHIRHLVAEWLWLLTLEHSLNESREWWMTEFLVLVSGPSNSKRIPRGWSRK